MVNTLAFFSPGPIEIMLICAVGVLIFGKRLPDVGKNIGKGIVEFKKGLKGVKDDVDSAVNEAEQEDEEQADQRLEQKKEEQTAIETNTQSQTEKEKA